jgi:hypothetical protein
VRTRIDAATDHGSATRLCLEWSRQDYAAVLAHSAGDQLNAALHLGRALQHDTASRDRLKLWARANGLLPRLLNT